MEIKFYLEIGKKVCENNENWEITKIKKFQLENRIEESQKWKKKKWFVRLRDELTVKKKIIINNTQCIDSLLIGHALFFRDVFVNLWGDKWQYLSKGRWQKKNWWKKKKPVVAFMEFPLVDNVVGIKRAELGPVGLFCTVINPAPTSGSRSNDSKCRLGATGLPPPPPPPLC